MINRLISYYLPSMPRQLVYMLQQVEYDPVKFLKWCVKFPDLNIVQKRKKLVYTQKATLLIFVSYYFWITLLIASILFAIHEQWVSAALRFLLVPILLSIFLAIVVFVGNILLLLYRRPLLGKAQEILKNHKAVKIAVLGSYGKTTMKELLTTVLAEGKKIKATRGNMNVPISHARWVTSKVGSDEEVLIFEYGEGEPGDISKFARLTHPDYGIITGLAPNHLDRYPSMEALADDLLSIRKYVDDERLLLNEAAVQLAKKAISVPTYGPEGIKDWAISNIKVDYDGTSFIMTHKDTKLDLKSQLLGRHQVGPLAAVAALAFDLGLTPEQIEAGVAKTEPFEHRMKPRSLHGAWIIDDTYNGNLEGIRAGLELLNDLDAKRKIYVTPGLVDQGIENERVHTEIGQLIATAKPNKVVLMNNSVTKFIRSGLQSANYAGDLVIEDNPLQFYENLESSIAAGDLVIMQNDWTDNYQ